jgi:hypothetical protein
MREKSYVVKQDGQIVAGPYSIEDCVDWIMDKQGEGIGISRGGYEVVEAGQPDARPGEGNDQGDPA